MIAIDTNVLFYAVDGDAPERRAKAIELLTGLELSPDVVLPWQVVCEFLALLRKRQSQGRVSADDVETLLSKTLASFPVALPTIDVLQRAMELCRRHSLSHWDSLLLAACLEAGVTTLYSEDLSHEVAYDGVTVVNPFR